MWCSLVILATCSGLRPVNANMPAMNDISTCLEKWGGGGEGSERVERGEGRLTDLRLDVSPVLLASELLGEDVVQGRPHADDSVSHVLHLNEPAPSSFVNSKSRGRGMEGDSPLGVEDGVGHDGTGDPSTVNGRVGVHGPDETIHPNPSVPLPPQRETSGTYILTWESTLTFSSADPATTEKAPTRSP